MAAGCADGLGMALILGVGVGGDACRPLTVVSTAAARAVRAPGVADERGGGAAGALMRVATAGGRGGGRPTPAAAHGAGAAASNGR